MIDKSAVTAVFEALGPERVAAGLLDAHGHTWEDCFLARAYGAARELVRAIRRDPSRRVPNLLGLALAAADAAKLIGDRKSTRLNSSHLVISYAVFCLKK